jgi:hypothetical protein
MAASGNTKASGKKLAANPSHKIWKDSDCRCERRMDASKGGQAVSDTMCAKTTETSRCQRCGSEFDWLSDGTKVHAGKQYFESDSLLCLERQLNAANERIKRLEEAGDELLRESDDDANINRWLKAKEAKP